MEKTVDQLDILDEPTVLFDERVDTPEETKKLPDEKEETEESSTPDEEKPTDEQDEDKGKEEPKAKPKISSTQKRINEVIKKQRTAERRTAELERLTKEKDAEINRLLAGKSTVSTDGEPALEDYEDYDTYNKAWNRWDRKQETAETLSPAIPKADTEEETVPTEVRTRVKTIEDEGNEKYPDYSAVAMSEDVPYSDTMREMVLESPNAVDIAYYFGTHLDVAMKISALPPGKAAREIINIESKFTKSTTNAPAPLEPLKGGEVSKEKNPAKMGYSEYKKWRESGGGG